MPTDMGSLREGVGPLEKFSDFNIWVAWQTEAKSGSPKPSKIPYSPHGGAAKSNDASTWGTLNEAQCKALSLPKPHGLGGVGIMLTQIHGDLRLGGIDLDSCYDANTGVVTPWAERVIGRFASYTEISPSQTGLKTFFLYGAFEAEQHNVPRSKVFSQGHGNHPPAIEFYLRDRYFTVTGQQLGNRRELRVVSTEDLTWIVTEAGPELKYGASRAASSTTHAAGPTGYRATGSSKGDLSLDDLNSAFNAISNEDLPYDDWIRCGIALKAVPGDDEAKFEIFDRFSRKSTKYQERYTRSTWEALKPDGRLSAGSIVHWARESDPNWKPSGRSKRPVIVYDPTDPKRMAREGERALLAHGVLIFQQGGKLVRVVRHDQPSIANHIKRDSGALVIHPVNAIWLTGELMAVAQWMKRAKDGREGLTPIALPRVVADTYCEMVGEWGVPTLSGTVETPTLYKVGETYKVLQAPGFDPETGLLYDPGALRHPHVPRYPTEEDARNALSRFCDLLHGFPFVPDDVTDDWQPAQDEGSKPSRSRSVVISAYLLGSIRRSILAAPMHAFDAVSPGTGKSYLARILCMILTGRSAAAMTWIRKEEEQRKRVLSVLIEGDPIMLLDNATTPIGGNALNILLTEPIFKDRLLGKNTAVAAPTNCLVLATGNNLEFEADTTRRVVRCRMDARLEHPENREFASNPLDRVLTHRGDLVVGALTILIAYIHAGQPLRGKVKHVGSYEDWTLIREAIVWLGQPDPADTMREVSADDPAANELRQLMDAWWECFGSAAVRLSVAVDEARRGSDRLGAPSVFNRRLFEAMHTALRGRELTEAAMGRWFKRHDQRILDGRRFVRGGDEHKGRQIALMRPGAAGARGALNTVGPEPGPPDGTAYDIPGLSEP